MRPYQVVTSFFIVIISFLLILDIFTAVKNWVYPILLGVYILILVLGSAIIQWNFYLRSYSRGNNIKKIALTFDDGPAAETEAILDVLKEQQVPATFFIIGLLGKKYPSVLNRMDAEGHVIGNHSYYHSFNFDWKSAKYMTKELNDTNEAIKTAIGKSPKLFRPPYGVTNPNLARAVNRTGMYSIGWNIRSFDTTAKTHHKLLKKLNAKLKGGNIILLHDSMTITREILTEFIINAREMGYTFVRVDNLLDIEPYA